MFVINPLKPENISDYRLFTYPRLRNNLTESCSREDKVILAASYFSKPAGLIVARVDKRNREGIIQSLYVVSSYRGLKLGTKLLQAAENILFDKGCKKINIYFPIDESGISPIFGILDKNGWSSPVKYDELSKFKISSFSWIHRISLDKSCKPIPWQNITPNQLQEVRDGDDKWYPSGVSPFQQHLKECNPDVSFWLMRNGQVLGWLITVPVAKDTLSYERVYICEKYQHTGQGIKLLAHAFKTQLSLNIPYGSTMINYYGRSVNLPLKKFYEKRIKPHVVLCKGYYISDKSLK